MNLQDVENLAELAKIEMSSEEKKAVLADMEVILNYVKVIESVELDDVVLEHDIHNAWREDAPMDRDFSLESIVAQFPAEHEGFLKVKKIL